MKFKKVTYTNNMGDVIARVDHLTGELQLNQKIFDYLPKGFREFVLLHEEGHLVLKTSDEFQANGFAIRNFIPVNATTDELGRRIVIMTQALTPGADRAFRPDLKTPKSRFSNFDIAGLVAGAIGGITQSLPALGIGSKSRIEETNAVTNAQLAIVDAQIKLNQQNSKNTTNMILTGAGVIVVLIVVYFIVKSFN